VQEDFDLDLSGELRYENRVLTLPEGSRRLIRGSSWGVFTIACTMPIALFVGLWMYKIRKGKVVEASLIGAVAVLACTWLGSLIPGSPLEHLFSLSKNGVTVAIAIYGFVASVSRCGSCSARATTSRASSRSARSRGSCWAS
jgi:hypothetical protein